MTAKGVYLGENDDSDEDIVKVINDSGTESSEDQIETSRPVDKQFSSDKNENKEKELMTEVQITLARLENELSKTNNKDNVQGLMNKLKSFLNVKNTNESNEQTIPTPPPRKYHKNRHSIAGTQDDMGSVRSFLDQCDDHVSPVRTNNVGIKNQPNTLVNNLQNDVQQYNKQSANLNNSINNNKNVIHFQKDILDSNRTTNNVGKQQSILKQRSVDSSKNENAKQFQKQSSLDNSYINNSVMSPRLDQSNDIVHIENPNVKNYKSVNYSPDVYTVESNEPGIKPLVATLTLRETNQMVDDAEDGDISSDDDENNGGNNIRNARKLLKFAKNEMKSKQLIRSNKKIKMKRSNTIDIPKNMKYYSSGDELTNEDRLKNKTPTFVPKTENDFKFLAFLKKNNTEDTKCYNSAARGGAHWSNRFSCIKTTFENAEKQNVPTVQPKKSQAKLFWQKSEEKMNQNNRLPWMSNEEHSNVVTGSLVVQTKPTQNFTHAIKSPFQAVNKVESIPQTKTSYTGTVKQMASEKFNKIENINMEPKSVGVKNVNSKINNFENNLNPNEYNNAHDRQSDSHRTFASTSTTTHRNFVPQQTNFKPIPQKPDVPQNYKPIVQPVYPYPKPQAPTHSNGQPTQFIKKQFPEPQYQKPIPKVMSPQQGLNAYREHSLYDSPSRDYHNNSGIFSPYQEHTSGYNENPRNFQIQNDQAGFYESQISPYEPSVVEIHKSPLCTKNGSHFTPISPAVVDNISYEPQTVAVSRVMGKEQCQQAVIVNKTNKQHFNESTNVLKNIISQHQYNDNHSQNQFPSDDSTFRSIDTSNLPSNTSYVYPTPVNRPNVTVQPMNYSASSSLPQTSFQNYTPSSQTHNSYQQYPSPHTSSSHFQQSKVQPGQQYPTSSAQSNYQTDSYRFPPYRDGNYNSPSIPQTHLQQQPSNVAKTRPNSMYMHSDDYNPNVNFSNNPIYSSNNAPYALTGSKSSSSVYPSSVISPVSYPYRNHTSNVPQERNYQSIPSDQFVDSRHKLVANSITSFERATSQPPPPRNNPAIISNAPANVNKTNSKPSGGDSKISYMNYISQISPQTMQNKLHYSPGRKSISPTYHHNLGYGELSQSSTQSSISDNSPINKLNSPHMNLSTPSSPQFPAPPILTKTPQLKISSKTAFVPVKPFHQSLATPSIPKQHLKLPPSSPNANSMSPSAGFVSPPASSPKMPSVLQKSESWHQMVLDRMAPKKSSPIPAGPGKLLPKAKSSHSLSFAKQFEAAIPDTIEKKKTVEAYLNTEGSKKEINKYNFKQFKKTKTSKSSSTASKSVVPLSDNLDNVDEAFDSLFLESK